MEPKLASQAGGRAGRWESRRTQTTPRPVNARDARQTSAPAPNAVAILVGALKGNFPSEAPTRAEATSQAVPLRSRRLVEEQEREAVKHDDDDDNYYYHYE